MQAEYEDGLVVVPSDERQATRLDGIIAQTARTQRLQYLLLRSGVVGAQHGETELSVSRLPDLIAREECGPEYRMTVAERPPYRPDQCFIEIANESCDEMVSDGTSLVQRNHRAIGRTRMEDGRC
jgi:hypothetical protein